MADFVEKATLQLVDQASGPAKKINAELKALFATAAKLKGGSGRIDLRLGNIAKAQGQIRQLSRDLARLQSQRSLPQLHVRVDSSQVQRAIGRIGTLRNALGQPLPAAAVPMGGRVPRPGAAGGAGGTPRIPASAVVQAQVNWSPLQTLLHGFVSRIGYTIERAIINGFAQGLKTQDVADTRLALQQMPRERQTELNAAIDKLAAEQRRTRTGAVLSRGQIASMLVETLPTVRGDTKAAETLGRLQIQLVQAQIAAGENTAKAIEQAFLFAKAGEQSGRLTDARTGDFSADAARSFFGTLLKVAPDIGKEFTGSFVQQAIKYLRVSKFTQNEQGLATALFLNEEMGSTASVGLNQAIKQLSGRGIKKEIMAELERLGLITTKEVDVGSVGGRKQRRKVVDEALDEESLRQDIGGFVVKEILPRMLKEGLDATKPVDAAKFAARLTSDRTATDALTSLITRAAELQEQVKRALERDVSPKRQDELTAASSTIAFEGIRNQFEGLLGEVANSFKGVLVPAVQGASGALSALSSFIRGDGEGGGGAGRAAAAVAGTAGAGALAFMGGKALLGLLNPLTGSATALTGSATALNAAAAALTRAAVVQGARGSVPAIPGPAGGAAAGAAVAAGASGLAANLKAGLGLAIGALITSEVVKAADSSVRPIVDKIVDLLPEGPTKSAQAEATAKAVREGDIVQLFKNAVSSISELVTGNTPAKEAAEAAKPKTAAADAEMATYAEGLRAEIAKLSAQMAQNKAAEKLPGTSEAVNAGLERQRSALNEELVRLGQAPAQIAVAFSNGAESLATTNTNFQATFTAGAETLKTVGATIDTSAAQFGPTAGTGILAFATQFGQIAGQAIAAAASNINVTARAATAPANVGTARTTD